MDEELTDAQAAELQEALRTLREELEALLVRATDSARPVELDQAAVGRISRIDAIQRQQMNAASKRRAEARLRQVLSALANQDYGLCRRCEEPISYRRLTARPETPFCLDCAADLEG